MGSGETQATLPALPVAHAGHWIVDALTLLPAALIAFWFVALAIRERRRRAREEEEVDR